MWKYLNSINRKEEFQELTYENPIRWNRKWYYNVVKYTTTKTSCPDVIRGLLDNNVWEYKYKCEIKGNAHLLTLFALYTEIS